MSRPCTERDENGWRIPRSGTLSWEIYELAVMGTETSDIVRSFPQINPGMVRVLLWKIRNPENDRKMNMRRQRHKV